MWSEFDVNQLDDFVAACDHAGGVAQLYGGSIPNDVVFTYRTKIDIELNPFSETYVAQQIALYEEVSGRKLDQSKNEMCDFPIDERIKSVNPCNSKDVKFMAKHARAILSGIVAANLPESPSILDMGGGWGVSSELMAFCGATVTSVDINPRFVELNRERAKRLDLPIKAINSSFDEFETEENFDLIFFYECFHHAIRPWTVIERVGQLLKPGGKIALVAEPYVEIFPHWGLRLEPLSLYCIRKFGWFESGWSVDFIKNMFDLCGFNVYYAPMIGLDNGLVGIASKKDQPADHDFTIAAPYMHLAQSFHELSVNHIDLAKKYNELTSKKSLFGWKKR
jgi:2-polyprenyl-3-methyl-5-hydroxy-6-metoxy-1,4-benzoquinol methylase